MTGQEFRELRKSMKLSQEKLGNLMEVQKRTIINQEQSEAVPAVYEYAIRFLAIRSRRDDFISIADQIVDLF